MSSVDEPLGLLITWTCYGTWLPGDRRGHVSNRLLPAGSFEQKRNTPGTDYAPGDLYTRQQARRLQKHPTVLLNVRQAAVVAASLVEVAAGRGWRILRGAVMANHVHIVLVDCPDDGPAMRRMLKGVTQNALSRFQGKPGRWWTAGGSNRYLHGEDAILAAANYVAEQYRILSEIVDGVVRKRDEGDAESRGLDGPPG